MSSFNQPSGISGLDTSGKLLLSELPALGIPNVFSVSTLGARNSLSGVVEGDVCVVTADSNSNNNGTYKYSGSGNWVTISLTVEQLYEVSVSSIGNTEALFYKLENGKIKLSILY